MSFASIPKSEGGFTLVELMVVISIMAILATIVVINLAGQRAQRDVRIAENQLVTDIRKTQSYTLSARTLPGGTDVQYYILKFNLSKPNQYTIQAISDASSAPQLQDVETVNLPADIRLAASSPIVINRSAAGDTVNQNLSSPYLQTPSSCALISFGAPFGKVIFNDGCTPSSTPYTLSLSDDYWGKIVNFETNVACTGYSPATPSVCTASTDSIMTITLTDTANTVSKIITINGITGAVSFN